MLPDDACVLSQTPWTWMVAKPMWLDADACATRDAGTRNGINAGAEAQMLAADRRNNAWASASALMAKLLGAARAVAVQGFISGRALAPLPHTPPEQPTHPPQSKHAPEPMKMSSWPRKTKNDREASSSHGTHRSGRAPSLPKPTALLRQLPLAPWPEDYVGRGVMARWWMVPENLLAYSWWSKWPASWKPQEKVWWI
jgi:hypothetical protein